MSDYTSRSARPESFSYVGRGGHGVMPFALCLVIVGLAAALFTGRNELRFADVTAGDQPLTREYATDFRPPDEGRPDVAALAAIETSAALEAEKPLLLASVNIDDPRHERPTARERSAERERSLRVRTGDTLMSLMLSAGIDRIDAYEAVEALRSVFDPKDLRVGQKVRLTVSPKEGLTEVELDPTDIRRVSVRRKGDDASFKAFEFNKTLTRELAMADGEIQSSLYKAAVRTGVPTAVLAELVRIYSWDVDFQREIQSGDRFEVAYEQFVDEEGKLVRFGEILYATLTLSGDKKPLYRFEVSPGYVDYYNDRGQSAKRPLMRTPIDGARLSSGFGKRRHPVLGYTKMHRGVDFAAPTGTPIYAAGDGIITYRGRKGGYGNYIQIRHASNYHTAYAHMSGFKSGLNQGSRVHQGEIIGYVGSTGRSTGPHLHYEILVSNTQVNPLTVKMPSGTKLDARAFARFQSQRNDIDTLVAGIRREITVSQR